MDSKKMIPHSNAIHCISLFIITFRIYIGNYKSNLILIAKTDYNKILINQLGIGVYQTMPMGNKNYRPNQ